MSKGKETDVECVHPADYLEIRNLEVGRDVRPKTLADQTNGFTSMKDEDYILQQYHIGDLHFKALVHCTRCNQDIYIFGVDPACR